MEELETERLVLKRGRPTQPTQKELETDHQRYIIEHEDPDVSFELYQDVVLLSYFGAKAGGPFGYYTIYPKGSDQWIGHCPLKPRLCTPTEIACFQSNSAPIPLYQALEVEIGWALSVYHRKKGYATEAAQAIIDYGFQTLNLARIVAFTEQHNSASIRVMKRLGMAVNQQPDTDAIVGCIENQQLPIV